MIPDLLLAIASMAVLLSPIVVDAGIRFELRKGPDKQARADDDERASLTA